MKNLLTFTFMILLLRNICFGQATSQTSNCDLNLIYEVVNIHIHKIISKQFDKTYFISAETYPFDSKQNPCEKTDSVYCDCCKDFTTWDKTKLVSSKGTVVSRDSLSAMDYSCFISLPKFNKDKTKCTLTSSTHQSEWGGTGLVYYYKKKFGKWRMVKSHIAWVS